MKSLRFLPLPGLVLLAINAGAAPVSISSGPLNAPIPDQSNTGIAYTLTVPESLILTSVSLSLNLSVPAGSFGWFGDLYAYVQHDSGFSVLLNRPGRDTGNIAGYDDGQAINVTFADGAANGDLHTYRTALNGDENTGLTSALTGLWQPDGRAVDPAVTVASDLRTATLAQFNGLNSAGVWTLFLADLSSEAVYQIDDWSLQLEGYEEPHSDVPEGSTCAAGLALAAAGLLTWLRRTSNRR